MKIRPSSLPDKSLGAIFGVPLLIGVLTMFGLISALLGQGGVWFWLSWATLSLPILLILVFIFRKPAVTKR